MTMGTVLYINLGENIFPLDTSYIVCSSMFSYVRSGFIRE